MPERDLTHNLRRVRLLGLTLRLRRERYDQVYLMHRVLPLRLMMLATGAGQRTGFGGSGTGLNRVVPFETGAPEHDALRYARLMGWVGTSPLEMPCAALPAEASRRALELLGGSADRVAVNPGGGRSSIRNMDRKRWPPERFLEIIRRLDSVGQATALVGSAGDRGVLGDLPHGLPPSSLDLIGRTSVLEAAAVLSHCRALLTNDSGLMHLAGLVGTPTVALFGPTDPSRIGVFPASARHRAVVPCSVPCHPCYPLGRGMDCGRADCMLAIPVDRVWEELRDLLDHGEPGR